MRFDNFDERLVDFNLILSLNYLLKNNQTIFFQISLENNKILTI